MRNKSCSFVFLCLMVLAFPGNSYSQSALDGFDPNANNSVRSIAVQADGKILVGLYKEIEF